MGRTIFRSDHSGGPEVKMKPFPAIACLCITFLASFSGCYSQEDLKEAEAKTFEARIQYDQRRFEENATDARAEYFDRRGDADAVRSELNRQGGNRQKSDAARDDLGAAKKQEDKVRSLCCSD